MLDVQLVDKDYLITISNRRDVRMISPFESSSKGDINQFPTLALVTAASISFLR